MLFCCRCSTIYSLLHLSQEEVSEIRQLENERQLDVDRLTMELHAEKKAREADSMQHDTAVYEFERQIESLEAMLTSSKSEVEKLADVSDKYEQLKQTSTETAAATEQLQASESQRQALEKEWGDKVSAMQEDLKEANRKLGLKRSLEAAATTEGVESDGMVLVDMGGDEEVVRALEAQLEAERRHVRYVLLTQVCQSTINTNSQIR